MVDVITRCQCVDRVAVCSNPAIYEIEGIGGQFGVPIHKPCCEECWAFLKTQHPRGKAMIMGYNQFPLAKRPWGSTTDFVEEVV